MWGFGVLVAYRARFVGNKPAVLAFLCERAKRAPYFWVRACRARFLLGEWQPWPYILAFLNSPALPPLYFRRMCPQQSRSNFTRYRLPTFPVLGGHAACGRCFFMLRSGHKQSYNWQFLVLRAKRLSVFISIFGLRSLKII